MKQERPTPSYKDLGWTADFSQFRKKVEPVFGPIDQMAETDPDIYAHLVLSHGFMEFAGVTGLFSKSKGDLESIKEDYMRWAGSNNLSENLLEDGWKQFLND